MAILNLLLTQKGERIYDPEYGSDLKSHLFEPLDFGTAGSIKDNISKTIDTYEPRVSIETLLVEPNLESNGFDVRLDFQVLSRADIPPISIEFFLLILNPFVYLKINFLYLKKELISL